MIPSYQLKIDQKDLAPEIKGRIQSITIADEEGMESDSITVQFEDADGKLAIPRRGVKIGASLGYVGKISPMGTYVVDEVELETGRLVVSGKGFDTDKALKTMKNRSFKEKNLVEVVEKVAKENSLKASVSEEFSGITFEKELAQQNESDLNLLTRLAKIYNAVLKIQGSNLVFVPKNSGQSASGKNLPEVEIKVSKEISWNVRFSGRSEYKKVVAKVYDIDTAETTELIAGDPSGFPVLVLPGQFTDKNVAKKQAESRLSGQGYQSTILSLNMPGTTDIGVGSPIRLSGARQGVDGSWVVSKITRTIDTKNYTQSLECVKKLKKG